MKLHALRAALPAAGLALPVPAFGAEATSAGWHAQSLGQALAYMILFAAVGVLCAIAGYKLFDRCTPGELHREIVENKNIAAAIVGGAVIIGVCIIVAAAMLG